MVIADNGLDKVLWRKCVGSIEERAKNAALVLEHLYLR